ncbi:MAG: acyclic terpene utilization AtuA family protein [Pseudomonadota bacterium]
MAAQSPSVGDASTNSAGDAPVLRIGGASGFWGDAALATPQLIAGGELDFLVYDYLAEITMSIMARARAADASRGYATDFVSAAMAPNLEEIAARGIRVISNAGGVNPAACASALEAEIAARGLGLRVAVVTGDDLMERLAEFLDAREMFSSAVFPDPKAVASINAYLGAFPIAAALDAGADIVITGRCVDSAVTLGACIHAFSWGREDLDRLAQGSLAGHILECGTQATGGNFTDWESIADSLFDAGYPIAEVAADGSFRVTKPEGTGGLVSVTTVGEQMLYEIGDPGAYLLPDVCCDFRDVRLEQLAPDVVGVSGARGRGVPDHLKVSATWADGFRAGQLWTIYGRDADAKAHCLAQGIFQRTSSRLAEAGLPGLSEESAEILGSETHFGAAAKAANVREVDLKIAAKHPSSAGIGIFLKEMVGLALTAPPGLTGFAGARPKPTPVVRLFSMLVDKASVPASVSVDGVPLSYAEPAADAVGGGTPGVENDGVSVPVPPPVGGDELVEVPLERLAVARSGDKGDKANIGVLARHRDFLPWIAQRLSAAYVCEYFAHFLASQADGAVERFYLPGSHALNFLLHDVLGGGGVASLRADPQGKGYAQLLLGELIALPRELAEAHDLL